MKKPIIFAMLIILPTTTYSQTHDSSPAAHPKEIAMPSNSPLHDRIPAADFQKIRNHYARVSFLTTMVEVSDYERVYRISEEMLTKELTQPSNRSSDRQRGDLAIWIDIVASKENSLITSKDANVITFFKSADDLINGKEQKDLVESFNKLVNQYSKILNMSPEMLFLNLRNRLTLRRESALISEDGIKTAHEAFQEKVKKQMAARLQFQEANLFNRGKRARAMNEAANQSGRAVHALINEIKESKIIDPTHKNRLIRKFIFKFKSESETDANAIDQALAP